MDHLRIGEADRVRQHTSPPVNERIDVLTNANVEKYASASAAEIGRRLGELEREWHVDRALMANFAILGGASFAMAVRGLREGRHSNGWLWFFSTQMAFLLMHAVAGWCPPASVFRRLGFRTHQEIGVEQRALYDALKNTTGRQG